MFIMMFVVVTIWAIVATALLCMSLYRTLQMDEKMDELDTQIEESLDVLDMIYGRLVAKSKLEVMSDDHVVRELVSDIRTARDVVLLVAKKIVTFTDDTQEDNDTDEETYGS